MIKLSDSDPNIKAQVHGSQSQLCCLSRLWRTRPVYKLVILTTANFFLITSVIFLYSYYLHTHPTNNFTKTCCKSSEYLQRLDHLTYRVRDILNASKLTHFLCYDSLWGEIHCKSNLPWADTVQLCVIHEEVEKLPTFGIKFDNEGLVASYDWLEGLFRVTDPLFCGGQVQLILFKTDPEAQWLRRAGVKRFRLSPDCRDLSLHCFHPYLLEPPLPLAAFGTGNLPVPRHGVAIQKHHYTNPTVYNQMFHNKQPLNC